MAEIHHLSHAPIVEALVNFQANASERWKPAEVRPILAERWPAHNDIQALRPLQINLPPTPEGRPNVAFPVAEGFIFRSTSQPTVHQAKRDGYTFSRLAPYEDWPKLEAGALAGWEEYRAVLKPDELHAVAVQFINRLAFPAEDFKLARYFTTPPVSPPELGWLFHGFHHQTFYAAPDSPSCIVHVSFGSAFPSTPSEFAFILQIEVLLKEGLAATGRSLNETLQEMRRLKDDAFFNLLTDEAVSRYQ